MSARISHIPFFRRLEISDNRLLLAAMLYLFPVTVLLVWRPSLGIAMALAPVAFLLITHGPSALYVLIATTFVFFPLTKNIGIQASDLAAMILIVAYVVDLLSRGQAPGMNRLARPYFLYLMVMFISVALEGFTGLSIRFFLRQILLFGTFMAVSHFGHKLNIKNALLIFVAFALISSGFSLGQFLQAGGGIRAFGFAGRGFGDHAALGFLIGTIFYLWSKDTRSKTFWAIASLILLTALAATQTRASVITAAFGLALVIILAIAAGRRRRLRTPMRNLGFAAALVLLILPILFFYTPIFEGVLGRLDRLGFEASGTILERMSLWKAALAAFIGNPVFGIGAGNYANIHHWVPEVKYSPVHSLVAGLSTHSVIMTSLAETGLAGFLAICFFFFRVIKTIGRQFSQTDNEDELPIALSLLVIAAVILISSIYSGSWFWGNNSYHMALFFGLIAAFRPRPLLPLSEGK